MAIYTPCSLEQAGSDVVLMAIVRDEETAEWISKATLKNVLAFVLV